MGAVQANMAVFGAEQVREQKSKIRYFDIYYAAVNTGGLIAFGAIAYLQINKGYFIGYLIPCIFLIFAFVLFLIGYKFFIHVEPYTSVITQFIPVVISAFRSWLKYRKTRHRILNNSETHPDVTTVEPEADSTDYLSFTVNRSTWSFFDYAKKANNGRFLDGIVNDIKSLRPIIVVFLLLTPYWLLYVQVVFIFVIVDCI